MRKPNRFHLHGLRIAGLALAIVVGLGPIVGAFVNPIAHGSARIVVALFHGADVGNTFSDGYRIAIVN